MTTPPSPAPILLDLDGTLIATRQLYVEAFARALHPHVGRRMSEPEIMALHPKSEIRFLRSQVGDRLLPEVLDHFYREYDALHPELFRGFYRGALEVVDELRRRGVPLGLVTGKSRRAWDITLRHLDPGAFHVLVFDDDVVEGKPDPEGLHWAVALLTEQGRVPRTRFRSMWGTASRTWMRRWRPGSARQAPSGPRRRRSGRTSRRLWRSGMGCSSGPRRTC
jgi:beta-phosphoglucomutase-like phosphatase (HAD superfamily)